MKIDLHCHYYPREYLQGLERLSVAQSSNVVGVKIPAWEGVDARMEAMRKAKVDMEVLSVSAPNVFFADKQASLELAQICNDSMAELCGKYPELFRGFISVPLTDVPRAIDELNRARRKPGMVGVLLGTNIAGIPLDSPEFWPFYQELDRLRMPAFIHPMDPVGIAHVRDYRMTSMMGFLFDTCMAATRMVLSGLRGKYPHFPIILCHLGGALPFIFNRIDHSARIYGDVRARLSKPPSEYFRDMYYDTAVAYWSIPLSCGHQFLGEDHIVLGTDYPFTMKEHMHTVPTIEASDLPNDAKEKIFWKNATRLLAIDPA